MIRILNSRRVLVRLGLAAATLFVVATAVNKPAQALSLINAGATGVARQVSEGLTTQVHGHGGGGGGHGGGGMHVGGGGHGGGMRFGGGGHGGGGVHFGGGGGGFRAGHVFHGGGYRTGGYGFAHHHRHFYGSYYPSPYYYHSYRRCRIVLTHYGPRRVCYHRPHRWHHWYHRHHHRYHW